MSDTTIGPCPMCGKPIRPMIGMDEFYCHKCGMVATFQQWRRLARAMVLLAACEALDTRPRVNVGLWFLDEERDAYLGVPIADALIALAEEGIIDG